MPRPCAARRRPLPPPEIEGSIPQNPPKSKVDLASPGNASSFPSLRPLRPLSGTSTVLLVLVEACLSPDFAALPTALRLAPPRLTHSRAVGPCCVALHPLRTTAPRLVRSPPQPPSPPRRPTSNVLPVAPRWSQASPAASRDAEVSDPLNCAWHSRRPFGPFPLPRVAEPSFESAAENSDRRPTTLTPGGDTPLLFLNLLDHVAHVAYRREGPSLQRPSSSHPRKKNSTSAPARAVTSQHLDGLPPPHTSVLQPLPFPRPN